MNRQKYDDIIGTGRPMSLRHKPMSAESRAAQFAPFAALNGYDAAVVETARLTDDEIERDDCAKAELDSRLRILCHKIDTFPKAQFTYFKEDKRKKGGTYVTVVGRVKEIDELDRMVILTDNTKIPVAHLYAIRSELFDEFGGEWEEWDGITNIL